MYGPHEGLSATVGSIRSWLAFFRRIQYDVYRVAWLGLVRHAEHSDTMSALIL